MRALTDGSRSVERARWPLNELAVDVYKLTLECDDVLLLCTDGLYNMVPHETLLELLNSNTGAEPACRKLVDLANENGGKDNITVIVSHFLSPQLDEPRHLSRQKSRWKSLRRARPIRPINVPSPSRRVSLKPAAGRSAFRKGS